MLRIYSFACTTKFDRHQVNDVQNTMKDEWTAEIVGAIVGETFNGAWAIANAHNASLDELRIASNAALAAEQENLMHRV